MIDLNLNEIKQKMQKAVEALEQELRGLRAGRANPGLVENIEAVVYGSKMPISQLATINTADAHLITIHPWDKSGVQEIVKAINEANVGLNPIADGDIIRVPIPPITEEGRLELVKSLGHMIEESKVKIRQIRKDFLDQVKRAKDAKEISEDEEARYKKQLQDFVDEFNKTIDKVMEEKKADLMTV